MLLTEDQARAVRALLRHCYVEAANYQRKNPGQIDRERLVLALVEAHAGFRKIGSSERRKRKTD